jgi:hypothetical protein
MHLCIVCLCMFSCVIPMVIAVNVVTKEGEQSK